MLMEHPVDTGAIKNLPKTKDVLPTLFIDSWTAGRVPSSVDKLERNPLELRRLVQSYLHPKWALVAFGITTSIPELLTGGFQGQKIVVLDQSQARTTFLYNTLVQQFRGAIKRSPPQNLADIAGPSTVHAEHTDDEIEEGDERGAYEEGASSSATDTDDSHEDESDSSDTESDSSDTESDTLQPLDGKRKRVERSTTPEEDTELRNRNASRMRTAGGDDGGAEGTPTNVAAIRPSQLAESEGVVEAVVGGSPPHRAPKPITENIPLIPETTLLHSPFRWANTEHEMVRGDDGFYYNREGVRYRRLGEEDHYTYEEASSILEGSAGLERVPSGVVDAMVEEAMDYADPLSAWGMEPREGRGGTTAIEDEPPQSESVELIAETPPNLQ